MGNKAIFLDRDGTINVDFGYNSDKRRLVFLEGVVSALKTLHELGFLLIIVTNQSGIGRGYYTASDFSAFQAEMNRLLEAQGVPVTAVYHCPHTEAENCTCRKPKTTLYRLAAEQYQIDFSNSYVIGDRERDLSLAMEEPVTGILLHAVPNPSFRTCATWKEILDVILQIEAQKSKER